MAQNELEIRHEGIAGGYRLIGVRVLFAVWSAYKGGRLRFQDVRVYLALNEMVSRRCTIQKGRQPRFTVEELAPLVGGNERTLRASLRRLEREGLSTWNTNAIVLNDFWELAEDQQIDLEQGLSQVANRNRLVPFPRRTLRWLAGCGRPALVATVFGLLFRCVYSKRGYIAAEGSISASWVAAVFGVDPRNVKRAKTDLRVIGWLSVKQADHWHQQRYGGRVALNLHWQETRSADSPPQSGQYGIELPHPESNKELLKKSKNQNPGTGRSGVQKTLQRAGEPSLRNVQPQDLTDAGRIFILFRQATERGVLNGSEHDRLQFTAAAVRASGRATRNPGGFFWSLVRDKGWQNITGEEEDRARKLIREHQNGTHTRIVVEERGTCSGRAMAADVRLVAHLTQTLESRGCKGDPYTLLNAQDPRWTRERWNRALRAWLTPSAR